MLVEPLGLKKYALSFLSPSSAATPVAAADTPTETRAILAVPTAQAATENPGAAAEPPDSQSNLSREAMARRQADLARKEQDLRALEKDLDDRLLHLQELEMRIQAMLKEAEEVKNAKYRHLVDVLGNMKAKQAASVLETLDEKIAVKVLAGMRGRQAGEILTYVNPGKAARLSEALARVQLPFE